MVQSAGVDETMGSGHVEWGGEAQLETEKKGSTQCRVLRHAHLRGITEKTSNLSAMCTEVVS